MWEIESEPIVNAIREWGDQGLDASTGEVVDGILIMRPAERIHCCCDDDLEVVAEAARGTLTWGLWRCTHCERSYSIGPKLPPTWVSPLARMCIELYRDYLRAVAIAYRDRSPT